MAQKSLGMGFASGVNYSSKGVAGRYNSDMRLILFAASAPQYIEFKRNAATLEREASTSKIGAPPAQRAVKF